MVVLVAATALVVVRCGQLAQRRAPAADSHCAASEPADDDLSLLLKACPHAAEFLAQQATGLAPPYHQTAAFQPAASAAITGVRIADARGDWLVNPDAWRVPEEHASPPQSAPPGEPPASAAGVDPNNAAPTAQPADPPPGEGATQSPTREPQAHSSEPEASGPGVGRDSGPAESAIEPQHTPAADAGGSPATPLFGAPQVGTPGATPRAEGAPLFHAPGVGGGTSAGQPPVAHPSVARPPAAYADGSPTGAGASSPKEGAEPNSDDPHGNLAHRELYSKNCYPSAAECAKCHPKQYDEWRTSSHAYAFVSPMYQKFEQKIYDLSKGTVGYFCQRCHAPIATAMYESRDTPLWEQSRAAREGISCIACHRVNERYGKVNGERRIVPGDIYAPVYGGIGGAGVAEVIANKSDYKVKTSPEEKGPGQPIHLEGRFFDQISHAEFCQSCHQVAVHPGIKLEVVWEQYRHSPAYKKGITCQDCHMGKVPGQACGYETCAIAEVGGKKVCEDRKHANHSFYGPSYSIAHPGIFPLHEDAQKWSMDQWLLFDWRAGWGTEDFEKAVEDGQVADCFPEPWTNSDDRMDARDVVEDNLDLLKKKRVVRQELMDHSLKVEGPFFAAAPQAGRPLRLHYVVTNMNEGHNTLTASLGAQPQLWANVVLIGPDGRRLWETGYTDSIGDLANQHSLDVRAGRLPFDHQLFNLQTMFLITGAVGTDREFPLPVNISFDQVPLLRPGALPISVLNHPPFIRMESQSLAPLGSRKVPYHVPAHLMTQPGRYRLSIRLRNRVEPIYFMRFCDATPEMERAMNEGILDIHPRSVEFEVR
ncbi:multiheme c-type cytochrome [Pirellulimonas nuda]|nr:multiheme c-type cytochrome [Pirellulimonas nuda]